VSEVAVTLEEKEMICEVCGEDVWNFARHHISYEPEITMIVCKSCHRKIHLLTKPNDKRRYICPICGTIFWNFIYEHPKRLFNQHKQWHVVPRREGEINITVVKKKGGA